MRCCEPGLRPGVPAARHNGPGCCPFLVCSDVASCTLCSPLLDQFALAHIGLGRSSTRRVSSMRSHTLPRSPAARSSILRERRSISLPMSLDHVLPPRIAEQQHGPLS